MVVGDLFDDGMMIFGNNKRDPCECGTCVVVILYLYLGKQIRFVILVLTLFD